VGTGRGFSVDRYPMDIQLTWDLTYLKTILLKYYCFDMQCPIISANIGTEILLYWYSRWYEAIVGNIVNIVAEMLP
jgi:hypothetical protein